MNKTIRYIAASIAAAGAIFTLSACSSGPAIVSEHQHDMIVSAVVDPTCTEAGYTVYKCKDENCKYIENVIDNDKPALGHSYTDHFCIRCDILDPEAAFTDGLEYTSITDKEGKKIVSYEISGKGTAQITNYIKLRSSYPVDGDGKPQSDTRPVTSIAANVFKDLTNVRAVVLASSIKSIGESAFEGCTALKKAELQSGVEDIYEDAFKGCTKLEDINFPNSLVTIRANAFEDCTSLKTLELPSDLEHVALGAFKGCSALKTVTAPMAAGTRTEEIVEKKVNGKTETEIKIVYEYLHFGYMFGAQTPDKNAEYFPTALTEVNVVGSLDVQDDSFSGYTPLKTVNIVGSVKTIGKNTFKNCTSLNTLELPTAANVIDDGAFSGCTALPNVTFPASLKKINDNAFKGCTAFTAISLPEALEHIGLGAFEGCAAVEKISLPMADLKYFGYAFGADALDKNNDAVPKALKQVDVVGTYDITENSFNGCTDITTVCILGKLQQIGAHAFEKCTGLSSLTFKNYVKKIGASAFSGCTALKTVVYKGTLAEYGATIFEDKTASPIAYSADLYIDGKKVKYKKQ